MVVTEIDLPDTGGGRLIGELRRSAREREPRILIVSIVDRPHVDPEPVDGYVVKPFRSDEL
ncbi:MAG: hypothetical protein GEV08_14010 [Acidimicrobiia bacterium]|nr:hypothetical protein [Acidimicrobiia bacterium]